MAMKLTIVVPCYNESATIEKTVERSLAARLPEGWSREIIVVDDGSDEATKDVLKRVENKSGCTVIYRAQNGGKGAAVKDALALARGDYVLIQDADDEYDPSDYERLLAPIVRGEAASVFGSRNLGNNNVPYSAMYFYGGLLVTYVFNAAFRTKFTDIATCYKVFPASLMPALRASHHDDFVFDAVDVTLSCVRLGPVAEVPVSYMARTKKSGKKLNWVHGIEIVLAIMLARFGVPPRHHKGVSKAIRFIVSGGTAAVVHLGMLYVLAEYAHIWYLISSGIAFILAFAVSFAMQKYWTFKNMDHAKARTQLPLHFIVAVFNLAFNSLLLYALVEYVGFWYMTAQVVATVVIAVESFFLFRWIYR